MVESGTGMVETGSGHLEVRPGDYVRLRRGTTHRCVPASPLRVWCMQATVTSASRALRPHARQLLEHAPYCERDLRMPSDPSSSTPATPRSTSSTAAADRPVSTAPCTCCRTTRSTSSAGTASSTRTSRRPRLRAIRARAPAAAGAPSARGTRLRRAQRRAAQGTGPASVHGLSSGPVGSPRAFVPRFRSGSRRYTAKAFLDAVTSRRRRTPAA